MTRTPYTICDNEIDALINKIKDIGQENLLQNIIYNIINLTHRINDADEILMDQYESVLEKARNTQNNSDDENLYKVASILRISAHKAHEIYIKAGKEVNNQRFLHIIK